jgi:hypothetical protein
MYVVTGRIPMRQFPTCFGHPVRAASQHRRVGILPLQNWYRASGSSFNAGAMRLVAVGRRDAVLSAYTKVLSTIPQVVVAKAWSYHVAF